MKEEIDNLLRQAIPWWNARPDFVDSLCCGSKIIIWTRKRKKSSRGLPFSVSMPFDRTDLKRCRDAHEVCMICSVVARCMEHICESPLDADDNRIEFGIDVPESVARVR